LIGASNGSDSISVLGLFEKGQAMESDTIPVLGGLFESGQAKQNDSIPILVLFLSM
jgi:hypothetical protein